MQLQWCSAAITDVTLSNMVSPGAAPSWTMHHEGDSSRLQAFLEAVAFHQKL